jgi:hypothetical protein
LYVVKGKRLILMMLMATIAAGCSTGASSNQAPDCPGLPYGRMAEGDLAFRCGRGVFSRAVTAAGSEGIYSHIGLLVNDGGTWKVVHAVPRERESAGDFDRVKAEPVETFFRSDRACSGALVHTGLADSAKVGKMKSAALQYARDSVPFDHDFSLEDSTRLYCTELVWRLYLTSGTDLSEGRRRKIHLFSIDGDCLMPEHLYDYTENETYFHF